MDTRQIQAEMARLQKILDEQKAKEEKVRQKAEAERKAAEIQKIKDINEAWDSVCDKQDINQLKTLLQKLETLPEVYSWDVHAYYDMPRATSHRYEDSDDESSEEETFPLSHVHNDRAQPSDTFMMSLLLYAMRVAIAADNDVMLNIVLEVYVKHYGKRDRLGLEYPIYYAEGDSYENNVILPLIYAIVKKSEKCALLLIEKGADPNARHFAKSSFCGASLNQSEVLATALSLTIESGLTRLAKALIDKGAAIEADYIEKLRSWEQSQCYHYSSYSGWFADSFDDSMTPFLLAAKYNNIELINYFLEKGVNIEITNKNKQSAVDLTTDTNIKALLLSSYSLNTRLERIHYQGPIAEDIKCAISGKIMERAAITKDGQHFCKYALVENNRNTHEWTGLHHKKIDMKTYINLLSLPDDKALQNRCREFVERVEEQVKRQKLDNATALLQGKGKKR